MKTMAAPLPPSPDRILPGVALMLAFCALAPMLDVCAKLAAATLPVGQIVAARFVVQGLLMLPLVAFMGLDWRIRAREIRLVTLRALMLLASTYSFVAAVSVMPIADALAIAFVEPFILLLLGAMFFGDEVGPRRIAASVLGFAGALLVIQPSLTAFGWVAIFPLATALSFAIYMLVTRTLARSMHPVMMQFQTSVMGSAMILPLIFLLDGGPISDIGWESPQGREWLWLFGVGAWASLSHMCMTYALKFAPSATLAPLHYLEIIMAVTVGYLFFGDFPNLLTWAGIAIISGSGLYIIHRERLGVRARLKSGK